MSDEFDNETPSFSAFVPLLVLLIGILGWAGYQDYVVYNQRAIFKQQIETAGPVFTAAQNWQARYASLMKDLFETSRKDPAANAIKNDAVQAGVQAGLIRVNNTPAATTGTNSTANPAPPAK